MRFTETIADDACAVAADVTQPAESPRMPRQTRMPEMYRLVPADESGKLTPVLVRPRTEEVR